MKKFILSAILALYTVTAGSARAEHVEDAAAPAPVAPVAAPAATPPPVPLIGPPEAPTAPAEDSKPKVVVATPDGALVTGDKPAEDLKEAAKEAQEAAKVEATAKASERYRALTEAKDELGTAAELVLEIARLDTVLAHPGKVTPKELVFLRERREVLGSVLPLRVQQEDKLTEDQRAEIVLRFRWIGETLRREGSSTQSLPKPAELTLRGLVMATTMAGTTQVNPELARALHGALELQGIDLPYVPNRPASGWFGYDVGGDPVY